MKTLLLPINPFKRLAKEAGIKRISNKACELLAKLSEEFASDLLKSALEITKSQKRTTMLERDVELAFKLKVKE